MCGPHTHIEKPRSSHGEAGADGEPAGLAAWGLRVCSPIAGAVSQRTVPEAGEVAAALARARPSALLCLQDEFLLGTECRGPVLTSGTRAEKQH